MEPTTVLLTGATGHMGSEALKFLSQNPQIRLRLFALPDNASRRVLRPYRRRGNIRIIEGDLCSIDDVRRAVNGCDYVLHLGAIIPPVADRVPELTDRINFGGTINVIRAIQEQTDPDRVRLVYIGTVASLGNRPCPVHWARVGDPMKISRFDAYATSKVRAERAVIESGLKYWVSIRQSGMLHRDFLKLMHPIMFHQPLDNHIEWSTAQDSGRALYNLVTGDHPDEFWRNTYNLGGGSGFRETYHEFLKNVFAKMGAPDIHGFLSPRDFATRNFHCVWYSDSDRLEEWLHFRRSSYEEFWKSVDVPFYIRFLRFLPAAAVRRLIIEPLSRREEGTLNWIENGRGEKLDAYFGGRSLWERIPEDWNALAPAVEAHPRPLHHGYDDAKQDTQINLDDCREAAAYRGGTCLSRSMMRGDMHSPLRWKCGCGKEFAASPGLVLRAGHWCPVCDINIDGYGQRADRSRFFAQVYESPMHAAQAS